MQFYIWDLFTFFHLWEERWRFSSNYSFILNLERERIRLGSPSSWTLLEYKQKYIYTIYIMVDDIIGFIHSMNPILKLNTVILSDIFKKCPSHFPASMIYFKSLQKKTLILGSFRSSKTLLNLLKNSISFLCYPNEKVNVNMFCVNSHTLLSLYKFFSNQKRI